MSVRCGCVHYQVLCMGSPCDQPWACSGTFRVAQTCLGLLLSQLDPLAVGLMEGRVITGYRPRSTGMGVPAARQTRAGQGESAVHLGSLP